MNAQRDIGTLQRIGEAQIGGRVVNRIAAHDDQQVDFARAHVGNEVAQGFSLIHWVGIDRISVENRLADVTEFALIMRALKRERLGAGDRPE